MLVLLSSKSLHCRAPQSWLMAVLTAGCCVCCLCPSSAALSQMGYNLSPQFTQLLVSRYCPRSANPAMQLDRFIQVCTQLQVLTEAFREKDTAVQGNIRLSFEDFVTMTASRML